MYLSLALCVDNLVGGADKIYAAVFFFFRPLPRAGLVFIFAKCIFCTDTCKLLARGGIYAPPPSPGPYRVNNDQPNAPKNMTCADGDS